MFNQAIRIFAHLEEISFLFRRLHLTSAVRTFAVHKLGLSKERLTRSAVHSFIISFVNISLIVQFLKDLLYLLLMVCIRCTDEFIIRSVHQIPDSLDFRRNIVYKFLRRNSCFFRLQLNLLTVFICSCLEEHIVSLASFIARNRVRQYDLISVSDVRFA